MKVDSGSYAAFTKHSPSSQVKAAKVIGVRLRPHTADAVSACTQVRVSRHLDTSTTTQVANIVVQHWKNQWFFLSEICMATPLPHCWHNSKKFYWSLKLTILWNFGNSCEELSWNHRTSTPIDVRRMVLLKEQYAESRKELLQVVLQSGLDENWRADSMVCYCKMRKVQSFFFLGGKTPNGRRCGEPFRGTVNPCG